MRTTNEQWEARTDIYKGEKELPRRPGSLVFLTLPSNVGGKRVERKRPTLISWRGEK